MKKKLRVGLDLDGVVLYNPARIVRPIARFIKGKHLIKRDVSEYFHPSNKWEEKMWEVFHWSSLMLASGLKELQSLVEQDRVELYLVTGRYNCLKRDSQRWLNQLDRLNIFKAYYFNDNDERPDQHKAKLIEKLNLDVFVEDNWDIVSYLGEKFNSHKRIIWLTNILDKNIQYPYKVNNLKQAVKQISKLLPS